MPSSHLILCCPLLLLPLIPPSIRVFSNESTLHVRWPKYWSFSFSIIPSKEHPGLISFRMDWLEVLAGPGSQHGGQPAGHHRPSPLALALPLFLPLPLTVSLGLSHLRGSLCPSCGHTPLTPHGWWWDHPSLGGKDAPSSPPGHGELWAVRRARPRPVGRSQRGAGRGLRSC